MKCPKCGGTGYEYDNCLKCDCQEKKCWRCGGTGLVTEVAGTNAIPCPECREKPECEFCKSFHEKGYCQNLEPCGTCGATECPYCQPPKDKEGWEEEFWTIWQNSRDFRKDIPDFIRNLVAQTRQDTLEEVILVVIKTLGKGNQVVNKLRELKK